MEPDDLLTGDEGTQGSPALDSTAGLSPEELAAPPTSDEGSAGGAGDGGTNPAPADPNAAAATTQAPTIRDAARTYGLDLSQYEDDAAAFAHLVRQAQRATEANYYTDLGRQIAPHYQGVSEFLRQQQGQQAQPQQRDPWVAPEFDERWLQLVDKDPTTGRYVAKAGVNPQFAEKVQAYADHLDNWTGQLARDPEKALAGIVQKLANQQIEQRFGQHQAQGEAQSIIQANAGWVYQTDASGRRLVGQDGRFVPTPMGARYYTHLQSLKAAGVNDARTLDTLAKQLLQGEHYAAQAAGQGVAPAKPQTPAAQGRPNVNQGQADPSRRHADPAATAPRTEGLSLSEMLRAELAKGGVTDADFSHLHQ